MTQKTVAQLSRMLSHRLLLAQGLGWIGSIGILSGGMALAQSASGDIVIPDIPDQSVDVAPVSPAPEIPQFEVAPESFAPESSPAPQITPEVQVEAPEVVLESPKNSRDTYEAPSSIVFSERSTGCQSMLRQGQQVNYGPCGAPETRWTAATPSTVGANAVASAVQVGPLSVTPVGGFTVGTSSSVRDYYKRTVRPPGHLGNGNIRLIFPLSIPAPISSIFGWRVHPISGDQRFHSGTDLAAPLGTPVLAAYAGRVAIADFLGGYGLTVTLEHNKNTQQTLYAHLSEIFVKPGELIKQGDVIGRVGSTGNSTGPHLHFEFRQLTLDGWVAMDAGSQLEYALAQLVKAMQTAQANRPNTAKS